jgi:predicted lipoprotein with Yx(FWY)xxD motif
MISIKRSSWVIFGLFIAMVIVACGGTSTGTGPYGVGGNTGASQTATAAANTGSGASIKTAIVTVNGKSVTILTNGQGMTLYYRTSDSATSVCSGGCASVWPPLLSSSVPSSSLPGKLSVQTTANGSQVEYNGHPLYTYSGDTAAGQTSGEGFGGIWFVVTTDLTA